MTLALTPEQKELSESVGRFAHRRAPLSAARSTFDALAQGKPPEFWDELTANGFHAVHLPENCGGQGGELLEAALVLVQDADFRAHADGDGWVFTGQSDVILGMCSASVVLVAARTGGGSPLWAAIDTARAGVTVATVGGTDLLTDLGTLRLDRCEVAATDVLTGIDTDRAEFTAVALTACMSAGIAQWCVEAVTDHLRTREQFGTVIGTFQALQHSAAMLSVNTELATAAAWDAVRAGEAPDQHQIAAATAALMTVLPGWTSCSKRSRCSARSGSPGSMICTCTDDARRAWPPRSAPGVDGPGGWAN